MPNNSECQIRIYDPDFNWVAETHQAESVQFTRELYGVGSFEIHIHPDKSGAMELIKPKNIIVINHDGHKSGIVREFTIEESRGKSEFVIYGDTGSGKTRQMITVPPTQKQDANALGWDKINAAAETVIKHYAGMNMVTSYDRGRIHPHVTMTPDQARGTVIPWKSRYAKLDEELYNICSYADIGYEIYADTANKRWLFDVITGTDRSKSQDAVSPVSFTMEYQNLDSYRYVEDYQNYKNVGYTGGSGEDENRLVYTIGANITGDDRWETFLDCGNAANIDELIYYGNQKMNEYKEAKTVEVSALPRAFIFDKDYFLGDIVTIIISRIGLRLDTRITAVKEIWERPSGYKAEARFGDKVPNIFTILNKSKEVR
ncbi:MAG: siphovirus ReqiPepy6 Gp37-like family protein [Clostridiales bacterium]|jgi:hypothetical protein|nr:siphovirus ReqiPepy6 Gp37-like family protein [Clostridiales bacterium]